MLSCLFVSIFMQTDRAGLPGTPNIDHALIGAAAEAKVDVLLLHEEAPVHEQIQLAEQLFNIGVGKLHQLLKGVTRVGHEVLSPALQLDRQTVQRLRLAERLAARKGHALYERIFAHILQQRVERDVLSAVKVVRLRIVAAGTAVRTALHEQRIAEAGAVYNRLPDRSRDANGAFHLRSMLLLHRAAGGDRVLDTVVLLRALAIVEAVERADEIARDAADALELRLTHLVAEGDAAVIRSREISLCLLYQQLAQCKAIYDKHAETILGNMDSVVFLGGREASTIKEISENWLGKATISMQTDSRSRGQSESYSQNTQRLGRELMTPAELATMPGDKCILQLRGLPPFFSPKYDLKRHPNYRYTAEADKQKNAFDLDRLINRRRRPGLNEACTMYEVAVPDDALTEEDEDILNYDDIDDPDAFA